MRLERGMPELGAALQEFARQTGIQILFFSQLTDGARAPELVGQFTVDAAITSGSAIPMQRNFDIVVTWSKAGPSMQSLWTSDEIVSG